MKKWIAVGLVFLVGIIGYVAAGPYLTISKIKTGIVERDSEILADNIEFSALRQSLKEQLNSVMITNMASEVKDNPFAALAAGFATKMVDGVVDAYITPTGLARIMEGKKPNMKMVSGNPGMETGSLSNSNKDELFTNARYTYDSMSKFSIWVPNEKGEEARFVLKREGISWKLVNMIVPIDGKP